MHFDPPSPASLEELAQAARAWTERLGAPDAQGWRDWPCFATRERSYARLTRAPGYELWLIRWPDGTAAPMHDHGGAAGVAGILEGSLRERIFVPGDPPSWRDRRWTRGALHRFASDHLHEVWNESGRDAWSLHAYAPRLASMRFYGVGANDALETLRTEAADAWR